METFDLENDTKGNQTYFKYVIDDLSQLDTMTLGMLTNNDIKGLVHLDFTRIDTEGICRFNISSNVSLKQVLESTVKREHLLFMFECISETLLSLDEYMIPLDSLIIDIDKIMVNVSTYEIGLICLPVLKRVNHITNIGKLFKDILFMSQPDVSENNDYVGKLLNYINSTSIFSLSEFKDLIVSLKSGGITPTVKAVSKPNVTQVNPIPVSVPSVQPSQPQMISKPAVSVAAPKPVSVSGGPVPASGIPSMSAPAQSKPGVAGGANSKAIEQLKAQLVELPEDDDISLFYLLQHYNNENTEKYKRAKAVKDKNAEINKKIAELQGGVPAVPDKGSKKAKAKKESPDSGMNFGYALPNGVSAPPAVNKVSSVPQPPKVNQVSAPVSSVGTVSSFKPQAVSQPINPTPVMVQPNAMAGFGATTALGVGDNFGDTTVLTDGANSNSMPYLLNSVSNQKEYISKAIYKIGKDSSCDFIIRNNAVSRSHATIFKKDANYFLMDNGSTNHTFVNDVMIAPNQEYPLHSGDKVKFANEEFRFNF